MISFSQPAEVLQKSLPGVPDGQKNVWVRLCAEGFRPAAVQMAAGAGAKETPVGTYHGTEKRNTATAGDDSGLAGIQREMQIRPQEVPDERDSPFKSFQ